MVQGVEGNLQGLFIIRRLKSSPFVVTLRRAQDEP